jgi:hypothetical protein
MTDSVWISLRMTIAGASGVTKTLLFARRSRSYAGPRAETAVQSLAAKGARIAVSIDIAFFAANVDGRTGEIRVFLP